MMALVIPKSSEYAESSITFVGIGNEIYGRPQYVLIDSDEWKDNRLKFPGLRFRAPLQGKTLEDAAAERFEEQTGLKVVKNLGLRSVVPARSRHDDQWIFRNIFVGVVDGTPVEKNDPRNVYVADAGHGVSNGESFAYPLGNSGDKIPLEWITRENHVIADLATNIIHYFDWKNHETNWMRRISCIGVEPQTSSNKRELGCGLGVSSMMLVYRPEPDQEEKVILLRRKGDDYPGYAGGKIETPKDANSKNLDPVSCCVREGAEEFGFDIEPLGLIGVACTPIDMPSEDYHNSIVSYAFLARPVNPLQVKEALKNPREYLESKMENYVVESLREHRDRISRGELRMPDMMEVGKTFFKGTPGDRIPLNHIIDSGVI